MERKNRTFKKEQEDLLLSFLDIHCFSAWKILPSLRGPIYINGLEMMVSPVCNTACSYCYMKNYSPSLYPCAYDGETLLKNCEKIMRGLYSNSLYPGSIEIFSGEFFNLPFWKEYLNIIFTYLEKMTEGKKIPVIIPTNGTFFLSEEKTREIQNFLDKVKSEGFSLFLSISVDGKYLDNETRPLKNGKKYEEDFYDRMFTFGAKNKLSYHPMVGAKGIKKWIENFDWYLKNIQKYYNLTTPWQACNYLYLLEVRNPDWTTEELNELSKFLRYLIDVVFEDCLTTEDRVERLQSRTLNIFSSLTSSVGRGLGCSIQQCLDIRVGDLALVQCHRTSYEELLGAYLDISEEGEFIIKEVKNVNSYIFTQALNFTYLAKCSSCPINFFCSGPCLGCNYEINKDLYTVVPTVCDLEYKKTLESIKYIEKKDPGVLPKIISSFNKAQKEKKSQLERIIEFIKIKNKENRNDF